MSQVTCSSLDCDRRCSWSTMHRGNEESDACFSNWQWHLGICSRSHPNPNKRQLVVDGCSKMYWIDVCMHCMLGHKDARPINKAWRVGCAITRKRALELRLKGLNSRITSLNKRPIIPRCGGDPIYLHDDLKRMQIEHRKMFTWHILQAPNEWHELFIEIKCKLHYRFTKLGPCDKPENLE